MCMSFRFQNLLQRHGRIEDEIKAFETDVNRLDKLAILMTKAANTHKVCMIYHIPRILHFQQLGIIDIHVLYIVN